MSVDPVNEDVTKIAVKELPAVDAQLELTEYVRESGRRTLTSARRLPRRSLLPEHLRSVPASPSL